METVTKVEKSYEMLIWLNPKSTKPIGNQQPNSEQEKAQRLSGYKCSPVVGILLRMKI